MSDRPLDFAELARLVRRADADAVLVPARLVRRVIRHQCGLTGFGFQVPHRKCLVTTRDRLIEVATAFELDIGTEGDLPSTVFLLAAPVESEFAAVPRDRLLLEYWRLLFHVRVHAAIAGRLGAAGVRKRIAALGRDCFDEAVAVLRQERMLLPPGTDVHAYEEFAATFLELYHFAPGLIGAYFPAIDEPAHVQELLAREVDDRALFESTRLQGALDPEPDNRLDDDSPQHESTPAVPGDVHRMQQRLRLAENRGNDVRAAVLAVRAGLADEVERPLRRLAERLWVALGCADTDAAMWHRALSPLVAPAARGFWPPEARLLADLQSLCVAVEQAASAVDFGGWVRGSGRQPLERPMPFYPLTASVRLLRRALQHQRAVRLRPADRDRLCAALGDSLAAAEGRLRNHLRPKIVEACNTVGLRPGSFPETVAGRKLTDELLDRVVARGFFTLADIRDAIARNNLKLPDAASPSQWWNGDELLAANVVLADSLPGTFRYGEIYFRWLQRASAAAFGTRLGRWITLNLLVPLGGALLAVEGPLQIIAEFKSLSLSVRRWWMDADRVRSAHGDFPLAPWPVFLAAAAIIWLLIHVAAVRRYAAAGLRTAGKLARRLGIELPVALWQSPLVQRVWAHPAVRAVWQFGMKPLVPAAAAAALAHGLDADPVEAMIVGAAAFLGTSILVNSQLGREAGEIVVEWAARRWRYLSELLPGVVRWILDFFRRLLEGIDRGLYAVDEWLQFRAGDGQPLRAVKTAGGLVWSAASYVVRFVVILFVEPQINPVKHFPVVTLSHKLLLPLVPALTKVLERKFGFHFVTAGTMATVFTTTLPGVFGFLVWELTENWRLYRANRPKVLRPAIVGGHGETLPRLLRPAFHSGKVPKLFARLRKATRRRMRGANWRAARRIRASLQEVAEAVQIFAERELIAYLRGAPDWTAAPVHVAGVHLATNRIRIALGCAVFGPRPLTLTFVEKSGWLLANVAQPGWLSALSNDRRRVLDLALNGFYRASGVDLVREQVEQVLGPNGPHYDIGHAGLTLWPGPLPEATVRYDLTADDDLHPVVSDPEIAGRFPVLRAGQLLLSRRGLPWARWTAAWHAAHAGLPFEPVDETVLPPSKS